MKMTQVKGQINMCIFKKQLMQSQIKDTFMSELGGILGSDPLPCILSYAVFG